MKIKVIGNGNWGSALGKVLLENGHDVTYWQEREIIETAEAILISIPAQAIRSILPFIKNKNALIINSAKGIENSTHKLPFQIVEEVLGQYSKDSYFSLIGPSFAEEVNKEMPTLVNLGYRDSESAEVIKKVFQTPYFRLRLTRAIEAIELSGALKNVYAIATGLAHGLGFGNNTRAKLIVLALEEIYLLISELGYKLDSNCTPGTLGDLILTATSFESRNYTFGALLSKYDKDEALRKVDSTVEGLNTALSIPYFAKETGLKLPLASLVYNVITSDNPKGVENKFDQFVGSVI